jgi:hypothetical protein
MIYKQASLIAGLFLVYQSVRLVASFFLVFCIFSNTIKLYGNQKELA